MKLFSKATVLTAVLLSVSAFADTGSLKVHIVDSEGNPVAGVTVKAHTVDSLSTKQAVTDENGDVRLFGLDPSTKYVVDVTGSGYQSSKNGNVRVVSNKNFELTYSLSPASDVMEEVVVMGKRTQLVDTTSAINSVAVTLDLTESLPTGRSYQAYLQLAPGTKPSLNGNPSSKSGVNYSDAVDAKGRTSGVSTDNVYYIDGINVTDNYDGTHGGNFNSEIIQEQQIITGGVPAQYEGGSGLISRVVTKSGSNEFTGSVNYYFQNDSLVADDKHIEGNDFSTFDAAVTLGGPIIKDKLWFFTSYQIKEREDTISDPLTGKELREVATDNDLGFAKITWQATDADRFVFSYFNDPQDIDGSDDSTVPTNRDTVEAKGGDNYKVEYSHTWDDMILTINYADHESEKTKSASNSSTRDDVTYSPGFNPTNIDLDLGGHGQNLVEFRSKEEFNITFDYFLDTDSGSHDIKVGYSSTTNERELDFFYTGDGAQYSSLYSGDSGTTLAGYVGGSWTGNTEFVSDDYNRIRDAMSASSNSAYFSGLLDTDSSGSISDDELGALIFDSSDGNPYGNVNAYRIDMVQTAPVAFETEGETFFIQDSWNLNQWTVNVGVRAEKWKHKGTDGSNIFTFDWEYAPRVSVVYDINDDGQSKIWAYSGRYYDPIRTDMTSFAGTLTGPVREEQIYAGNQWLTYRTRGGSQTQDAFFAPKTKTPYTDEIMIGYSRSLTDTMSVSVTYTERESKDILEDYDLHLYTETLAGTDFYLPLSYFGYNALPDSNYVIGTLKGGKREYKGYEITFQKSRSDSWQMLASYTYNDAEGTSNSDGNADFQGDVVWLDPRAPGMSGDQPGNIEHIFKVAGSYFFDNGIEVGAIYNWNSGMIYSETWSVASRHLPIRVDTAYEAGGTTQRWVDSDSIGSHKNKSYGTLDLRVKYSHMFGKYNAEFFLDVFNVLDEQSSIRQQDLLAGDGVYDFGKAMDWVEPRRFYIGTRVTF